MDLLVEGGKIREARAGAEAGYAFHGDKLRDLIRGTAEAMCVLDEVAIPQAELRLRLELNSDELRRRVGVVDDGGLLRLMISFFFKSGIAELGCEFTHKSFRDYLFAEQIVETIKAFGRTPEPFNERNIDEYWKDFEPADPRYRLSRRLADVLGPQWITEDIGRHVSQLIAWEILRCWGRDVLPKLGKQTDPLTKEQWARVRDGLADLWDWWGEGVPVRSQPYFDRQDSTTKFASPPTVDVARRDRFLSRTSVTDLRATRVVTIDSHLGDGLFQLCCDTHREIANATLWDADTKSHHKLNWSQAPAPGEGARRYQSVVWFPDGQVTVFAPSGRASVYFHTYIDRINGAGYRWRRRGFFPEGIQCHLLDLRHAFLSMQLLRGDWSRSNLSKATIAGAVFNEGTLHGTIFSGAKAYHADFSDADLTGADLTGAALDSVNFIHARVQEADFRDADLREANFRGCGITKEQLSRARNGEMSFGVPKKIPNVVEPTN